MKEIKKEIASTVTMYVADDGKEFNKKDDCEEYEGKLNLLKSCKMVDITDEIYSFYENYDVILCGKFENEDDIIASGIAMKKAKYISDSDYAIDSIKNMMEYRKISFPFSTLLFVNEDNVYPWIGGEKEYIKNAKSLIEKLSGF